MSGCKDEKNFPRYKVDYLPAEMILASTPKNFFDTIAINGFSVICFSTTLILTAVICAAAFFRYILKGDLTGYEEWVKIFAFWLYFSGAIIGSYNRTHVSADLVQAYVPAGKLKKFLVFLKDLITVGVTLLFAWYGFKFFEFGFMGPLGIFYGPDGAKACRPHNQRLANKLMGRVLVCFPGTCLYALLLHQGPFHQRR